MGFRSDSVGKIVIAPLTGVSLQLIHRPHHWLPLTLLRKHKQLSHPLQKADAFHRRRGLDDNESLDRNAKVLDVAVDGPSVKFDRLTLVQSIHGFRHQYSKHATKTIVSVNGSGFNQLNS